MNQNGGQGTADISRLVNRYIRPLEALETTSRISDFEAHRHALGEGNQPDEQTQVPVSSVQGGASR